MFQQSEAEEDHKGEVQKVTLRLFGTHDMPPIAKKAAHHRRYYNYQLQNIVKKKHVSNWLEIIIINPVMLSIKMLYHMTVSTA